ncbi:MAG TPA: transglutaminase-like domain-containing protein [Capillimicrobium sp.]|jgi:regulator of sirC expression with transglutaminase-like and TPR domain
MAVEPFPALAVAPDAPLDELALALAAEFRPVDVDRAMERLDTLAAEVDPDAIGPRAELEAVVAVLGGAHGFAGDRASYDAPANSMLDQVLERRRGLPILLSVVYVEVGRRAGIPLAGVGLPGHFVCGHVGGAEVLLVDPFNRGRPIRPVDAPAAVVRPWSAHETALRMLNNLVSSFARRGDVARAIRAAELRLLLPADDATIDHNRREALSLRARLN